MFVITYKKIWFAVSILLIALSVWSIFQYGFNLSTDFKGGTITEASYTIRPDKLLVESKIKALDLGGFSVRPSGENNFIIRTKELSENDKKQLLVALQANEIVRQNTIGPTAGAELQSKAVKAIVVVVMMIVIFITFAFRKVSKPIASWKYGLVTIIGLAHDVIIPTGVFILLGYEIDLLFVTGLLAILGYSVHDKIVVFDRVRENLSINQEKNTHEPFDVIVGKSINQTFARSINTSLTIFITLFALYIFGAVITKTFALLLIIGLIAGTYSSIFVASPMLVVFHERKGK